MPEKSFDLLTEIHEEVKGITKLLTGDGEPHKGMIVRLDRVETKVKRADWVMKALVVAGLGGAASYLADMFGVRKH